MEQENAESITQGSPKLSIITPAYNEEYNLDKLYERLCNALSWSEMDWEWILVDDHSGDETFAVIQKISSLDKRVKGIRLARNSGSHMALLCGIQNAKGECAVTLASDLQDPPELIEEMYSKWLHEKAQVVWAVREKREGEKPLDLWFSKKYYAIMRTIIGMKEMPASGADFFLVDRKVIDALRQFRETHVSILALITWMGFRQSVVNYTKQARENGVSGWTLKKKVKLVIDSVVSFSYLPIRLMSYFGISVALVGFLYALYVIVYAVRGATVSGWSSLMVVILIIGGIQTVMMGVLGEYLWRALDEARRRPQFIIEDETEKRKGSE